MRIFANWIINLFVNVWPSSRSQFSFQRNVSLAKKKIHCFEKHSKQMFPLTLSQSLRLLVITIESVSVRHRNELYSRKVLLPSPQIRRNNKAKLWKMLRNTGVSQSINIQRFTLHQIKHILTPSTPEPRVKYCDPIPAQSLSARWPQLVSAAWLMEGRIYISCDAHNRTCIYQQSQQPM